MKLNASLTTNHPCAEQNDDHDQCLQQHDDDVAVHEWAEWMDVRMMGMASSRLMLKLMMRWMRWHFVQFQ